MVTKTVLLFLAVLMASPIFAKPVLPGHFHVVDDCQKEITAEPNDVIEIRIPNPVLPKRVHNLDVDATGDAVVAGVAETTNGLPGGDRISIFVGLKSAARSGTILYTYQDGENKEHKCKLTIQVYQEVGRASYSARMQST